jgi:hypothetical protein
MERSSHGVALREQHSPQERQTIHVCAAQTFGNLWEKMSVLKATLVFESQLLL